MQIKLTENGDDTDFTPTAKTEGTWVIFFLPSVILHFPTRNSTGTPTRDLGFGREASRFSFRQFATWEFRPKCPPLGVLLRIVLLACLVCRTFDRSLKMYLIIFCASYHTLPPAWQWNYDRLLKSFSFCVRTLVFLPRFSLVSERNERKTILRRRLRATHVGPPSALRDQSISGAEPDLSINPPKYNSRVGSAALVLLDLTSPRKARAFRWCV